MPQMRLNNIMILHGRKERTDALSIASCMNQFVSFNEHGWKCLASFEDIILFKDYIVLRDFNAVVSCTFYYHILNHSTKSNHQVK